MPVQVYLDREGAGRLNRLAELLGASKSDVLRRGMEALEREVTDPAAHPVLRLIGMAAEPAGSPGDTARDHDRVLAEAERARWQDREGLGGSGAA